MAKKWVHKNPGRSHTHILFTGIENYEQSLVKQNRRYIKHKATAMLKQNKVKLNQIPGTS